MLQSLFKKTLPLLLTAVVLLSLTSCKKKEEEEPDTEVQTAIDHSYAQNEFSALRNLIDVEAQNDTSVNKMVGSVTKTAGQYCSCSQITVTILAQDSAEMVIDFGAGCVCLDGRSRSGKIKAVFDGRWSQAGSKVTVTPDNFKINTHPFSFTHIITNNGRNGSGNLSWTTNVVNASIVTPTGTISWNSVRTTEWIAGEGDFNFLTNEYLVTGTASGVSRTGLPFNVNIDQALHVKANCSNIVAGQLSLTPQGKQTRVINYGSGACDKQATLTIGSYTATINLP